MVTLQLGDQGPGTRAWQRIVGVPASKVDGKFGPNTDAHVREWQAKHGVDPDGVIGPLTRAAAQPDSLIKAFEGLRLRTYDDHDGKPLTLGPGGVWRRPDGAAALGYPTIGWGRRLWPGERVTDCTPGQAQAWLDSRLRGTEYPAVERCAPKDADAAARVAMTVCAYNCGTGWLAELAAAGFTEAKWLSRNKTMGVVSAGLVMRRAEEWALFAGLA